MIREELQGRIRIILETVELLITTKNNTILHHRYELLREHIPSIAQYENTSAFIEAVGQAIEDYKRNYPDRELKEIQKAAITTPSKFPLSHFYLKSICSCLLKFTAQKKEEIAVMKQQKAKRKRIEEIKAAIAFAKNEIQTYCHDVPQYAESLEAIENTTKEVEVI